jgi:hypothetical protein
MLQARFKVLCEPTITQNELIQFFKDIESKEMNDYIDTFCGESYVELKKQFDENKNELKKIYDENNNVETFVKTLAHYLENDFSLSDDEVFFEPIIFVCYSCHSNDELKTNYENKIQKQQELITQLTTENTILRTENNKIKKATN